jgi:hypothetical protein
LAYYFDSAEASEKADTFLTRDSIRDPAVQRFLTFWLTLLAAGWLTRAAVSAVLFERAGGGPAVLFQVFAVPLLQAAILAWATRPKARRTGGKD